MNLMKLGEQYCLHLAQSLLGQVKLGYDLLVTVQGFILDHVQKEKKISSFLQFAKSFPTYAQPMCYPALGNSQQQEIFPLRFLSLC